MSRCIIRTKSGRCVNQAAPGKRTCGQHPKRRKSRAGQYTRKRSAAEVLGREFERWSSDEERAAWKAEAEQDAARLADEMMSAFHAHQCGVDCGLSDADVTRMEVMSEETDGNREER